MSTNQYKDMLKEGGIADTRVEDIHQGMQALWSAYVQLDFPGARAFNKFVGERTVREALIQWADTQPGHHAAL